MGSENVTIEFQPAEKRVQVRKGIALREAAEFAGIELNIPCGGKGLCGKCKVIFESGAPDPTSTERDRINEAELAQGYRLSCQTAVTQDAVIYVPDGIQGAKILTTGTARKVPLRPGITKRFAVADFPSVDDLRSDLDRVTDAFDLDNQAHLELSALRSLGRDVRASEFRVTGVFAGREPIAFEPGDTTADCYGIALDIGTTTLAAYLLDLNTGGQVSVASAMNPQAHVGDDVISRISHVMEDPEGLRKLQASVIDKLNELVRILSDGAGICHERIYEVTVAGNTCMTHLFLGVDPTNLAVAPYVPVVSRRISVGARHLGIDINEFGRVHVLPNIAGYVGADTVGVILASGFYETDEMTLAVDIGTNGEIVLGSDGRLLACSTAAGPAFEGAHIRHGTRAAPGAIDGVWFEGGEFRCSVIGGIKPSGICGSGLLDAIICMLQAGIIEPSGRIVDAGEISEEYAHLRANLQIGEQGSEFILAEDTSIGEPVVITQRDVRELQLAKGAIAAGIRTLMDRLQISPERLDRIVLAGAFGNYLRKESAVQSGMIPDVPLERIHSVGNAAGEGAKLALISLDARADADRIADGIEYVELTTDPGFQERFADALMFGRTAGLII